MQGPLPPKPPVAPMQPSTSLDPDKTAVVVGMGPGGLVAAIEAAKKGCDVVLIEKRADFVRPQRLLIKPNTKKEFNDYILNYCAEITDMLTKPMSDAEKLTQLRKMVNPLIIDAEFMIDKVALVEETPEQRKKVNERKAKIMDAISKINKEGVTVKEASDLFKKIVLSEMKIVCNRGGGQVQVSAQTKDIQTFLRNRAQQMQNIRIIQPVSDEKIDVKKLDVEGSVLTIFNKDHEEKIKFKYIVDATGNGKIVNTLLPQESKFKEIAFSQKTRQETHFTLTLAYKGRPSVEMPHDFEYHGRDMRTIDPEALIDFARKGWKRIGLPNFYMIPNKDKTEFYLAGELPEFILDLPQSERAKPIAEWGKALLSQAYRFQNTDEMEIVGSQMAYTAFNVHLQHTEKPALKMGKDSFLVLVGDARATPNFHYGHGVEFATQDSKKFAECITPSFGFNYDAYKEHHDRQNGIILNNMSNQKLTRAGQLQQYIETMLNRYAEIMTIADRVLNREDKNHQRSLRKFTQAAEAYKTAKSEQKHLKTSTDEIVYRYIKLVHALEDEIKRSTAAKLQELNNVTRLAIELAATHSYGGPSQATDSGYIHQEPFSPRAPEIKAEEPPLPPITPPSPLSPSPGSSPSDSRSSSPSGSPPSGSPPSGSPHSPRKSPVAYMASITGATPTTEKQDVTAENPQVKEKETTPRSKPQSGK